MSYSLMQLRLYPQRIRGPSRGTSGRWRIRWTEKRVCPPGVPFQRLLHPTDTNRRDYGHAAAGRGWIRRPNYFDGLGSYSFLFDIFSKALAVIHQKAIIVFIKKMGRNHKVCRGAVAGHGDVTEHADAQQSFYVHIVGLGLQGIPEKDHHIDLVLRNSCSNLQVAAQGTAAEPVNLKTYLVGNHFAGSTGPV